MFFKKILDKSNNKPNKTWVDKCSKFYNVSMKSWLAKNEIEMNSAHNKCKIYIVKLDDR